MHSSSYLKQTEPFTKLSFSLNKPSHQLTTQASISQQNFPWGKILGKIITSSDFAFKLFYSL